MSDRKIIALPVPELERYVTTRQLAEIMGVSTRQIERWRAEGMPAETWGLRVVRYKPSVALQWARTRTVDRKDAA